MDRRLYFLLPDRQHALDVVAELGNYGIDTEQIHAIGDRRTRLDGLPVASRRQRKDTASLVEKVLWNANLVSFAVALLALPILPIFYGFSWWLLIPAAVMLLNFLIGLHFTHVPNAHLGEFSDALAHGEILLMVDVPESRVAEVETEVHQHHPEASIGGVGWGTQAFGL